MGQVTTIHFPSEPADAEPFRILMLIHVRNMDGLEPSRWAGRPNWPDHCPFGGTSRNSFHFPWNLAILPTLSTRLRHPAVNLERLASRNRWAVIRIRGKVNPITHSVCWSPRRRRPCPPCQTALCTFLPPSQSSLAVRSLTIRGTRNYTHRWDPDWGSSDPQARDRSREQVPSGAPLDDHPILIIFANYLLDDGHPLCNAPSSWYSTISASKGNT